MKKRIQIRWLLAYIISKIYIKYILRNHMTYEGGRKVDKSRPFILLGNHSCFYDFFFAVNAVGPYPIRFVVAAKYFSNPIAAKFLNFYGAIPKKLAERDMESMRKMIGALKNGDSVGIYPEGRVSMWGVTEDINPSTWKLVKKYGVDLVLVQNLGTFFLSPPFGGKRRFGKTSTTVKVYTNEDLENMNLTQVGDVIEACLNVDQYRWYKEESRRFRGREKAAPLVNLIYRCPCCGGIATLQYKGKRLFCGKCSLEALIKDCHMKWNKSGIPETVSGMYQWLREFEGKSMENLLWAFKAQCSLEIVDLATRDVSHLDRVTVSMDLRNIVITMEDEEVQFCIKTIDYIPFDVGSNFQIYRGGKLYIIKPHNKALAAAFSVMHQCVRDMERAVSMNIE